MSQYNSYARKLNEAFITAAAKYKEAYSDYQAAKEAKSKGVLPGRANASRGEVAATLEADFQRAKATLDRVEKEVWPEFRATRDKLGRDLRAQVARDNRANPADVDAGGMALLTAAYLRRPTWRAWPTITRTILQCAV